MINSDDFSTRLQQIINYYQLSSSSFADKIGFNRSSISHLLSGRNKPSLEFVLKVLKTFPEVSLYWLLNGKGSFPKSDPSPTENDANSFSNSLVASKDEKISSVLEDAVFERNGSDIERIVIFFKDGRFKEYKKD